MQGTAECWRVDQLSVHLFYRKGTPLCLWCMHGGYFFQMVCGLLYIYLRVC